MTAGRLQLVGTAATLILQTAAASHLTASPIGTAVVATPSVSLTVVLQANTRFIGNVTTSAATTLRVNQTRSQWLGTFITAHDATLILGDGNYGSGSLVTAPVMAGVWIHSAAARMVRVLAPPDTVSGAGAVTVACSTDFRFTAVGTGLNTFVLSHPSLAFNGSITLSGSSNVELQQLAIVTFIPTSVSLAGTASVGLILSGLPFLASGAAIPVITSIRGGGLTITSNFSWPIVVRSGAPATTAIAVVNPASAVTSVIVASSLVADSTTSLTLAAGTSYTGSVRVGAALTISGVTTSIVTCKWLCGTT